MLLHRFFLVSLVAAILPTLFSPMAWADSFDVNLRDTSAQIQYSASMGRDTLGKAELHAGVLYANKQNMLGDFGLLVKDDVGGNAPGVTVGVGIKGLMAKVGDIDAAALALGGLVRFAPFADSRFGIVGHLYFSPNIVTFGNANRYTETVLRLEYEIIPQAAVYVGYRRISFGFEKLPNIVLEKGAHLGVRMMF